MGYGHLRAAHALAAALGTEVVRADRGPYAGPLARTLWSLARRLYEGISRGTQHRVVGPVLRAILERITRLGPPRGAPDPTLPTIEAYLLDRLIRRGVGRGVVEAARRDDRALVTTYFVPALAAQHEGYQLTYCLVTDTDASRAWVPKSSAATRVTFLTPSAQASARLSSYGVPVDRIAETGFPLPPELLGGPGLPTLRRHLAARLGRLDPHGSFRATHGAEVEEHLSIPVPPPDGRAPLLTYAVGGAGAQAELARRILLDLAPAIVHGRLRVALVAGTHTALAERFARWAEAATLGPALEDGRITIVGEPDLAASFDRVHALLGESDVLWTKPSEMTFFAALGLPLLLTPPVGAQERANRRWALDLGVALPRAAAEGTAGLLAQLLDRGALAAAAWAGFRKIPADGVYRIRALVSDRAAAEAAAAGLSRGPHRARSSRAPSSRRASWP